MAKRRQAKTTVKAAKTKAAKKTRKKGKAGSGQADLQPGALEGTEKDWKYEDAVAAAPSARWRPCLRPWISGSPGGRSAIRARLAPALAGPRGRRRALSHGGGGQAQEVPDALATLRLDASKETDEYTLRPESFVEEAGTSLKGAMDVCRKFRGGHPRHASLQDHHLDVLRGGENAFYAAAAQLRIASYFNLRKNLNQWQSWLAAHGPILAGLNVDQTWTTRRARRGISTRPAEDGAGRSRHRRRRVHGDRAVHHPQ